MPLDHSILPALDLYTLWQNERQKWNQRTGWAKIRQEERIGAPSVEWHLKEQLSTPPHFDRSPAYQKCSVPTDFRRRAGELQTPPRPHTGSSAELGRTCWCTHRLLNKIAPPNACLPGFRVWGHSIGSSLLEILFQVSWLFLHSHHLHLCVGTGGPSAWGFRSYRYTLA